MFIKFGQLDYLEKLCKCGEMYFSPCEKFRVYEEEQAKGIGDKHDSGIHVMSEQCFVAPRKIMPPFIKENVEVSFITDCCRFTPTYCLKQTPTEYLSESDYLTIKSQFPKHTHALIIDDETGFLENVRYKFKNKAFSHKIFYEDNLTTDFSNFLFSGDSDILFYKPHVKKESYFFEIIEQRIDGTLRTLRIDKSNAHKTMFRKGMFFKHQQEYRIVLPHLEIKESIKYYITPFNARLISIEKLIR